MSGWQGLFAGARMAVDAQAASGEVLGIRRRHHPAMHAAFVHRHCRRRKAGVCERADRDDQILLESVHSLRRKRDGTGRHHDLAAKHQPLDMLIDRLNILLLRAAFELDLEDDRTLAR